MADLMLLRRRLLDLVQMIDYSPYFVYTIEDGYAHVTAVKRNEWLEAFGNLDIVFPSTIDGYPTIYYY